MLKALLRKLHKLPLLLLGTWVATALLSTAGLFDGLNRWFYDRAIHLAAPSSLVSSAVNSAANRSINSPVVFIAIDDSSLKALGRWPWSRSVHGQLLNQLAALPKPPQVVGFDILFLEPEPPTQQHPDGDGVFARAIKAFPSPVIAPALIIDDPNRWGWVKPYVLLSNKGLRLAHIHTDIDPDGMVRRYYPQVSQSEAGSLPYLGVALSQALLAPLGGQPIQATQAKSKLADELSSAQSNAVLLYPLPSNWLRVISYEAVLRGEAPAGGWGGARVLVGTSARGLGDQYLSPIFNHGATAVSGSELVLAALHTDLNLAAGQPMLSIVATAWALLVAVVLSGLCWLGLRAMASLWQQSVWLIGLQLGLLLLALATLHQWGWWLTVVEPLFAVLLLWLLWLMQKFRLGFNFIEQLIETPATQTANAYQQGLLKKTDDKLNQHIENAKYWQAQRSHELQLLQQIIQFLPEAALVLSKHDTLYQIERFNYVAKSLLDAGRLPSLTHSSVAHHTQGLLSLNRWLHDYTPRLTQAQIDTLAGQAFTWDALELWAEQPAFQGGLECFDGLQQPFLIQIKSVALPYSQTDAPIVVLTLTNLSVSNTLRQQREASLNFLSHDLRSPQTSILALLELEGEQHPSAKPLFEKIEKQIKHTLYLADGFVQLTRAEQVDRYQFQTYNLSDVLTESVDALWPQAQRKAVKIKIFVPPEEVLVNIDHGHFGRTLINLISNAIHHSAVNQTIVVRAWAQAQQACCTVEDMGGGINPDFLPKLFQPFQQSRPESRQGFGLGLAYVKTVIDQHHGQIDVISPVSSDPSPCGTRFEIKLALLQPA